MILAVACRPTPPRLGVRRDRSATLAVRTEPGALIAVMRLRGGRPPVAARLQAAAPEGLWMAVALPRGDYRIVASKPGRARTVRDIVLWPGPTEATLTLTSEATVSGRVLTGPSPLGLATIIAEQPGQIFETRADSDGRYRLGELSAGPVVLRAEKSGFAPVERTAIAPGDAIDLQARPLHRLEGTVRAIGRTVVEGAMVRVGGSGLWPPRDVAVDGRGGYAIDLVEGTYEIRAQAPGLASVGVEAVDLSPPGARRDLDLLPAAALKGTVRAEDGSPVSGAGVTLASPAGLALGRRTVSDASGAWTIGPLPAAAYSIDVAAAGFLPVAAGPVDLHPPSDSRLDATLSRGAAVRGEVIDDAGQPVAGARIQVWLTGMDGLRRVLSPEIAEGSALIARGELGVTRGRVPWPAEATSSRNFVTSPGGRILMGGLPAGAATVVVTHPDFPEARSRVALHLGETSDVRLVLLRGAEIAGRVLDDRGHPLAQAIVRVVRDDKAERTTVCGDGGDYVIGGLRGRVELSAELLGYLPARREVDLDEGARLDRVDLVLIPANLAVEGRVLDEGRVPVIGALVRIRPGRGPEREARTDARGLFRAEGMAPGLAAVEVTHADLPPLRASVFPEKNEPLDLIMPYGGGIAGFVRDSRTYEPLVEFSVTCAGVSADGRGGDFVLVPLPVGPCTLEVVAAGYPPWRQEMDVAAGGAPGEITLRDVGVDLALP